jgi:hypothetical protein
MSASAIATLHLHMGDHQSFYQWMNRALDERDPCGLALNQEFLWTRARPEPQFEDPLRRVGPV